MILFASIVVRLNDSVLLLRKRRPVWQAGMLNLPGGKAEPGESSLEAVRRELAEETGLMCVDDPSLIATIANRRGVYRHDVFSVGFGSVRVTSSEHDEASVWFNFKDLPRNVVHDVQLLVTLAMRPPERIVFPLIIETDFER